MLAAAAAAVQTLLTHLEALVAAVDLDRQDQPILAVAEALETIMPHQAKMVALV
jgi:hypothetical protein